jgi:hypothetical protein
VVDGPQREEHPGLPEGETEEIDAIPVPAGEGPAIAPLGSVPAPRRAVSQSLVSLRSVPAVQAVAVAAGGFVAGAAVVGLARRRRLGVDSGRRRASRLAVRERGRGHRQNAGELLQIVGSRSLLLDVHLLGSAGRRR